MRESQMIVAALALRDGPLCYLCDQNEEVDDPFEIEHVKPRSRGGSNELENLRLAHRSCNRTKGTDAVVIA